MPWARSHSAWLTSRAGGGQLVDGHLAGDVLLAEPLERMAAALVAAVGAQPARPRSVGQLVGRRRVVERDDPTAAARERDRLAHPSGRGAWPIGIRAPSGASRPRGRRRRHDDVDEVVVLDADPHLVPPGAVRSQSWTGRLSSSSLARTMHGAVALGRSERLTTIGPVGTTAGSSSSSGSGGLANANAGGCELEVLGMAGSLAVGHLDEHVAQGPAAAWGRAPGPTARARPGPAPASTTVNTSGSPASAHHPSRARATTAPKSGPTSGLVRKSPRRPACPPDA